MRIHKIGIINLMVILVIFLKINSNYYVTISGLTEMEIGLGHKIGISQN